MNARAILLVALPMILGAGMAFAQDIPTDQELFASYCYGVEQARANVVKPPLTPCTSQKEICDHLSQAMRDGATQQAERMQRLRRYLAAKGYVTGQRSEPAFQASIAAVKTGQADHAICNQDGSGDRAFTDCLSCRDAPACKKCVADALSEKCKKTQRCFDLSALPF